MKHFFEKFMLVVCLPVFFISCTKTKKGSITSKTGPVEIEYVTWEPNEEKNPIITQFMKDNPDIKVHVTSLPDSNNTSETLDIIAMGGGKMDVWPMSSGSQFLRMQKKMLKPITQYLQKDNFDMKENFGSYEFWATYNGIYYGLPTYASVGMCFYNKDIFDKTGIQYPKDDWTVDDYMSIARKLTQGEGAHKIYGTFQNMFPEEWGIFGTQRSSLYSSDGLSSFSAEKTDFLKSLEIRKMLDDEKVEIPYSQIVSNFTYSSVEFLSGRAAMTLGYSWVVRDMKNKDKFPFDFRFGVCNFPRIDKNAPLKPSQVSVGFMGIPVTSKHPDEAWRFIKYYAEKGAMQTARNGNVPTYIPSYNEDLTKAFIDGSPLTMEQGEQFFDKNMHTYTSVPRGTACGEYASIINEEVGLYFSGAKTLNDVVSEIKYRSDVAIEKVLQKKDE
jgi:multiple sugar transport system substrate-binding protein